MVTVQRSHLAAALLLAGCQPCPPLDACDITTTDCQVAVTETVACLRGSQPEPPQIRVIDEAEYVAELEASFVAIDPVPIRNWRKALGYFYLSVQGFDVVDEAERQASLLAGFYSFEDEEITVLRRAGWGEHDASVLLAHEIVHAFQDREGIFDKRSRKIDSLDSALAGRAWTEGEADFFQVHVDFGALGWSPGETEWSRALAVWRGTARELAQQSE